MGGFILKIEFFYLIGLVIRLRDLIIKCVFSGEFFRYFLVKFYEFSENFKVVVKGIC